MQDQLTDSPSVGELATNDATEHLRELRDALCSNLVERDVAVRLALLAALAGEHLLLVGPPGTAKSLVARRLRQAFKGATYFERLLTRFTVPEELFGPLSIKGLEEDRYERITEAFLPKAQVAFLDEIFKANSAILNALLTLLNEREFDNGARREKTPLIAVIGASNELPEGEELDALYDRFLLRLHVGPVSSDGFTHLLALRGDASASVPEAIAITSDDVAVVRAGAERVEVPDDVIALLVELRNWCLAEEIPVSDRRWRKVLKLLQVSALTNGRKAVSVWDCWLLQHCIWHTPEEREKVYEWYAARVGASHAMDPERLTRVIVMWESALKRDQESRSQMRDEQGRALFTGTDGKPTATTQGKTHAVRSDSKEKIYLAPVGARIWRGNHGHWTSITDRTNAGSGYTETELNQMVVAEGRFSEWDKRSDYLVQRDNWLTTEVDLPAHMEPTRHKAVYVDDCLRQVNAVRGDITKFRAHIDEHSKSLEQQIHTHLWVSESFAKPAASSLQATRKAVEALHARAEQVRKGFEMLPKESNASTPESKPQVKGSKGAK